MCQDKHRVIIWPKYNELDLMLHTKFHQNWPTGSSKQDFLSIYTIYGYGSHLGHVTSIMLINFHFLLPKNYIQNLVENGPVVSEISKFKFLYVNNLEPMLRNDLDLQYSLTFIYWISCLHLQIFRPLAAIVSKISTVFSFSYRPEDQWSCKRSPDIVAL